MWEYWALSCFLFAVSKIKKTMCEFLSGRMHCLSSPFPFSPCLNCKTCLRLYRLSREKLNPATLPFPVSNPEITRKVLQHQMVDVKYVDHLLFPIYIALVISQLVHGGSRLKLYPIYLADQLHIQASHLPTVEMYLNWGLFIPGTPGESPPYFFFSFGLLCLTLFLTAVSSPSVPSSPYNSSKMLQQCLKEKWSLLQLPVSFRIDFF